MLARRIKRDVKERGRGRNWDTRSVRSPKFTIVVFFTNLPQISEVCEALVRQLRTALIRARRHC